MPTAKKLVVCGGNGFLGSRICKYAVARGWDVTSISRSGQPVWSSVSASPSPPSWAHNVTWERADILKPSTYGPLLKGANAVVHSMGILLEADYKGVLSGRESPISGLQRAFSATKAGSQNLLQRRLGDDLKPQEKDGQFTYELMNRDSAITLAQEASNEDVPTFAYVSAAGGAPVLPSRYISTKRDAESSIETNFPNMRSIFFRPPFLYDSSRTMTMPIAAMAGIGAAFNGLTGGALNDFLGTAGARPMKVDLVAEALVEALDDDRISGAVESKQIEELATRAWRKGML